MWDFDRQRATWADNVVGHRASDGPTRVNSEFSPFVRGNSMLGNLKGCVECSNFEIR